MKKHLSKLLSFFLCMSFFVTISNKANAAEEIIPVNISVQYSQTEARTILDMINEMRTSDYDAWCWDETNTKKEAYCGDALTYDYDLENLAMKRAAELVIRYDHDRPNGEDFSSIYKEENITDWQSAGENIAIGYHSAQAVNTAWREDGEDYNGQGHRRNILNPKFNCVGIGHVKYDGCDYWVEEFAYRPSVNTTKTLANDSEQITAISLIKSKIKNIELCFDKDSYILKTGETITPNIKTMINYLGGKAFVADIPDISVTDSSIATYSDGKISGVKEGNTTLTASLYGLTITDMPTITVHECDNHWNDGKITTEPTCIKEGVKTFTCTICGDTKTETISKAADKHLHSEIRDKKDATCKDEGYTGDTYCTDCGKKISSGQTIAKTDNHNWNTGEITTSPTCKDTGVKTFTCTICGNTKTETVKKTTKHLHTEIRNKKDATCKDEGYTGDTYCTDCGKKISSGQTIAKTDNHSYDDGKITTEPTCTKKGTKTFTCTVCGNTKTETVKATGHQHTEIRNKKDATCKEKGYTGDTYCTDCGKKISSGKSIAKTETHSYDDGKITTKPTCTKRGTKTYTCTICGNTKTETVKATGHSYGEYKIVKEPTATKDGLKSRTCTVCEKVESVRIAKTTSDKQNTNTSDKNSNQNTNTQTSQKTKTTKKIKLNRTKLTLKKGKTFRLKVTLTPINSRDKIIYKTSNKKIVTVSKTGKIKAKRKGKVNITVISGKKKIVCKVTVK
ncbi:sCP-like protein [Clostridium sp. CAG:122]|nr:sCP-like protein [Clostridium sp. CAG:122]